MSLFVREDYTISYPISSSYYGDNGLSDDRLLKLSQSIWSELHKYGNIANKKKEDIWIQRVAADWQMLKTLIQKLQYGDKLTVPELNWIVQKGKYNALYPHKYSAYKKDWMRISEQFLNATGNYIK